ncbi:unnamed protein product [Spirodela intermedia]|uniref:RWP-RK domain-containing protein n=1 Tax=Spirodela intermedia TaxID=51605 RepID=A0A7I8JS17_SPIIN|nr:unnamed protein product [Spirodela intermedia]CAA6672978.1 unnamed protein product [Spirodela intermedia]
MDDDFNFNFDSFILEEAALLDFNVETPPAAPAPPHHHHSAALRHPGEGESEEEEGSSALKKAAPARPRTSSIAFEDVSKFFYMPITEAAKAMRVGLTVLKKRCRELGISRWPHRKMKSLNSLIHNVQELGKGVAMEDSIRREIETLEEHKRLLEMMPEMQLTERTKKLRQACFKANFKKRRASQIPSPAAFPSNHV